MAALPDGVFPTMITPFTAEGAIDWPVLDALIEWYIACGCTGLFAVCLSSEMFDLTPDERLELARHVHAKAGGRVLVVASGTFGGPVEEQAEFVRKMGEIVDAVVVVVNQLAGEGDDDAAWQARAQRLLDLTPGVPLGLYECPVPYHRLLTAELLAWAAGTGRFLFHKDTCCVKGDILGKLAAVKATPDTPFRFYNANAATLLMSLQNGASGFSGISANFYPQLLAWLCANPAHDKAARVQNMLSVMENVVMYKYPTSAKHFLALFAGLPIQAKCRNKNQPFNEEEHTKLAALQAVAADLTAELGLPQRSPADFLPK